MDNLMAGHLQPVAACIVALVYLKQQHMARAAVLLGQSVSFNDLHILMQASATARFKWHIDEKHGPNPEKCAVTLLSADAARGWLQDAARITDEDCAAQGLILYVEQPLLLSMVTLCTPGASGTVLVAGNDPLAFQGHGDTTAFTSRAVHKTGAVCDPSAAAPASAPSQTDGKTKKSSFFVKAFDEEAERQATSAAALILECEIECAAQGQNAARGSRAARSRRGRGQPAPAPSTNTTTLRQVLPRLTLGNGLERKPSTLLCDAGSGVFLAADQRPLKVGIPFTTYDGERITDDQALEEGRVQTHHMSIARSRVQSRCPVPLAALSRQLLSQGHPARLWRPSAYRAHLPVIDGLREVASSDCGGGSFMNSSWRDYNVYFVRYGDELWAVPSKPIEPGAELIAFTGRSLLASALMLGLYRKRPDKTFTLTEHGHDVASKGFAEDEKREHVHQHIRTCLGSTPPITGA